MITSKVLWQKTNIIEETGIAILLAGQKCHSVNFFMKLPNLIRRTSQPSLAEAGSLK